MGFQYKEVSQQSLYFLVFVENCLNFKTFSSKKITFPSPGGYCGKMYMNTVRKFDSHTRTWSDVTPMHFRRCFTTTALLDGEIYVIGGYDGARRLSTVEKYCAERNHWVLLRSLNNPRSDCASVIHRERIFLFGGYGGKNYYSLYFRNSFFGQIKKILPKFSKLSRIPMILPYSRTSL